MILITGGAGFIGSHLALCLLNSGHNVRILDNLSPQIHGADPENSPLALPLKNRVDFIRGCVTSSRDMLRALDGIDTVVHLAAETGTGQSMYAIRHYSDVNIGGTALLLDLIANEPLPVKKIVVASSRAVYGEGKYRCQIDGCIYPTSRHAVDMEKGNFEIHCPKCGVPAELVPTDEAFPACPVSVYGVTKLAQEQMVLTVGRALGISAIALRYQNVYGPGQSLSNPYTGILSIFSSRIRNGAPINVFEDGKESRDFVYIDDVVRATAAAVEFSHPMVDVFNVGSGVSTDVLTVVTTLKRLLAIDVPVKVSGQFRVGDIRHSFADLTKTTAIFDWKPMVSMQEGFTMFVEWVKGERIQGDRYDESLQELRSKGLFR